MRNKSRIELLEHKSATQGTINRIDGAGLIGIKADCLVIHEIASPALSKLEFHLSRPARNDDQTNSG